MRCPQCFGRGGTCILIHDGSPHNREACKHAQWRDCVTCGGTGDVPEVDVLRAQVVRLQKDNERLNAFAVLVSDLDRCEHGRHEGDVCSSCNGPSVGNHQNGEVLGTGLSAWKQIVVPPRGKRHDPAEWMQDVPR